jgi:DNA modification methylase
MAEPYYADESVTLYHGDCREVTKWLTADVLVTDPPYGIAYVAGTMPGGRRSRTEQVEVAADETTAVRDEILALWGNRPALLFGSWRAPRPRGTLNRLIWHKLKTEAGARKLPWFSADEGIYQIGTGFIGPPEQNILVTSEQRSGAHGLAAQFGHPTPKPVSLLERLITKCPPGVIADPFAGSGSTLIASKRLGRTAIGVELKECYCEVIAKRLSQGVMDFGEVS